ncbi:MAG: PAS domain S-box protein [Spirochaetes bacterium]|nr:PAS domain S-box protein [Spirochaetota bacterium]
MSRFGQIISGFQILHLFDEVGSVSLSRAIREKDGKIFTVKILRKDSSSVEEQNRFKREFQILNRLKKIEGVIQAFDLKTYPDCLVMVMEDLGFRSLNSALIRHDKNESIFQSIDEFLHVAIRFANTLLEIHAAGIIHKNINPYSLFYDRGTGIIRIAGFANASMMDEEYSEAVITGKLKYFPEYISPEQTGRINRVTDSRSDLYSLGASFYFFLTGTPPFESDDLLTLVHAQIARSPKPLNVKNSDVPECLSGIIMKLLEKNAEDRYQSAYGLKTDLERCRQFLSYSDEDKKFYKFIPGQDDFSGKLRIPQKLYGIESKFRILSESFNKAARGGCELVLLTGATGTGKSAFAVELRESVIKKYGYFIRGNFEQSRQDIPYTGFFQAFRQLVELILIEHENILSLWRTKIISVLGENGLVLKNIIPDIEKIIGKQMPVSELEGQRGQTRFKLAFRNFIRVISSVRPPLVIFIDDLQWADAASLDLLKTLMEGEQINQLLIIAACREDNPEEVFACKNTFNEIRAEGKSVREISLENLQIENIEKLIQETLSFKADNVSELSEVLFEKTSGNPFMLHQLLENIFESGLLYFDYKSKVWKWDKNQISKNNFTNNVELLSRKIKKYSGEKIKLLELAACIGNEFDLGILSKIGNLNTEEVLEMLSQSVDDAVIIAKDDNFMFPETVEQARFRFQHDRVLEAVYKQIQPERRRSIHLKIANLLMDQYNRQSAQEDEQLLFDIVRHYNLSDSAVKGTEKGAQIAELNIEASNAAAKAGAFSSSRTYLENALNLMPDNAWNSHYDSMLRIHSQMAYLLSLGENYGQLKKIVQTIEQNAVSVEDTAVAKHANLRAALSRRDYSHAVDIGLDLLKSLGITIKRNPSYGESIEYLRDTANWFTHDRIKTLYTLPEASLSMSWIYETSYAMIRALYSIDLALAFQLISQISRLCFEKGLAPKAPLLLVIFAMSVSSTLHDIPKAKLITDAGLQLLAAKYSSCKLTHKISITTGAFLLHQYEHLKNTLPVLLEGYKSSLNTGMSENAAHCAWWYSSHRLYLGEPLGEVEKDSRNAVEISRKLDIKAAENCSLTVYQAALNLQGKSEVPWILKGENYNEDDMLRTAFEEKDHSEVIKILIYKAWLRFMFRQPESVEMFREAEEHLLYCTGMYLMPFFYFYDTLANTTASAQNDAEELDRIIDRVDRNMKEFDFWATNAPMNHQHKKYLMKAEKARIEGRFGDAALFYERAIEGSRENFFLNEEALSYELAAGFYLQQGKEEIAGLYITRAYERYLRWQAWAKTNYIKNKFSQILDLSSIQQEYRTVDTGKHGVLDIKSVIKASQIISGRIIMEDLLNDLMKILIENAGAGRGCLLLKKDGRWFIEADSSVDFESGTDFKTSVNLNSVDIDGSNTICRSIVRYVSRTHESVMIDDAINDSLFSDDPYIKHNKARSILCIPLTNRRKLTGILYLENNLVTSAFTPDRIEILEMLSGQAAIAIENALLFQQAQQEITERKAAEKALKESEERFKTIFESVNDAIIIHDFHTGAIIDVNSKMCAMFGYTREEALKLSAADINSNETGFSRKEADEWIRKTMSEGPQLFEWKSMDKNGRIFWTEISMRKALIDGRDRILVVARDISDRKKSESQIKRNLNETQIRYEVSKALSEAETEDEVLDILMQHSEIYSEAHVTICTFDKSGDSRDVILRRQEGFKSGIIDVVPTGTRLPASTYETIDFYNPDRPFVSNNIEFDYRQDPASIDVFQRSNVKSIASFPLSNGKDWIGYIGIHSTHLNFFGDEQMSLYQTLADQGGIALFTVGLREKIRESQQRLSLLVQQSPLGVIEWDMDFRALSWNPAAERIFNYSSDEAINRHISFLIPEENRSEIETSWQYVFKNKTGIYSETQNKTSDGNNIICEWFNTPLIAVDGQIIGVVSIVQDITKRKHEEEELEKHREHLEELVLERTKKLDEAQEELIKKERLSVLGQLTATVSHELRNPLGVIRSSAFYLKEKIKLADEKIAKHLNRIEYQIDLCNSIVEELLEYTRERNAEIREENAVSWLSNVFDDIQYNNIEIISKNIPDDLPAIYIDRIKMTRVVANLLTNAVQAVEERLKNEEAENRPFKPEINLNVEFIGPEQDVNYSDISEKGGFRISVEDNGIGMNGTTLEKAFDPLFTTKARGTGLGLSIVKKIIEEHDGSITINSKLNKGTKAVLWLPLRS